MHYNPIRALALLREGSGRMDAVFRDGQEEAIRHIVENRGRLLVVQKTGWGKSFVYFISAKLLREAGAGPAILVSPLVALMRDQVAAAGRMGLQAATLHAANWTEWPGIVARIAAGTMDILLFHPKQLMNERFKAEALGPVTGQVSLLVLDEAHCVSDWGHDFIPEYRLVQNLARNLPANLRLLATTATANARVLDDLRVTLGPGLEVSRGDLNRGSLTLQTIVLPSRAERLAWIAGQLAQLDGSGIIYALTKSDVLQVTAWLNHRGFNVKAYTSETGDGREELEQALRDNTVKALVATTALGMGFDKPDLRFVFHFQMPGSVVAYYQQVGRAGRAVDAAYGVLLRGAEDDAILNHFTKRAFPTREEVADVLMALEASPEPSTVPELLGRVNIGRKRLEENVLHLLSFEVPAPFVREGRGWQLTAAPVSEGFWERAINQTELRRRERQEMREYVALPFGGHMRFLVTALDGDPADVGLPAMPPLPVQPDPLLLQEAAEFLRHTLPSIEPRRQWPAGGLPAYGVRGNIPARYQAQPGRVMCHWGDAGWGELVKKGKYEDSHFSDDLVEACAAMVRTWNPQPTPTWVTAMPSLRAPMLVSGLAARLATRLGLPFHDMLLKVGDRPSQKDMRNSVQQARNLDGALALRPGDVPGGPVLLVDDMVDSRWTVTVAAWLLASHGAGPVFPVALADAGQQ